MTGGITANIYENCEDIPDPKSLNPELKKLVIVDCCYLGPQTKAGAFYCPGRHTNCGTLSLKIILPYREIMSEKIATLEFIIRET